MECMICYKKCKTLIGLARHIGRVHKDITVEEYYCKYINTDFNNICKMEGCNNKVNFNTISLGFHTYCPTCSNRAGSLEAKKTLLKKYGTTSPRLIEGVDSKIKQTCKEKYGVDSFVESKEFKKKSEETSIKNWGVKNYLGSDQGFEHFKKVCKEKYGYETPYHNEDIRNKSMINMKKSNLENYGTEYVFISDSNREKALKIKKNNFFNKLLNSDRLKGLVIPLFNLKDYKNVEYKYKWQCVKCNNEFEDILDNGRIPRCPVCFPKIKGFSNLEKEVYNYIKSFNIDSIDNYYKLIWPNELDIYIPSKNLAIEFNGLFWHSELNGKDKNYHLNKTLQCKEKEVSLIHIFEDEWIEKQEIVKSIIRSKLGLIENRVYARNCEIREVELKQSLQFLDNNHLQGKIVSMFNIGLYYNNELVSLLTYGIPRFNNEYDIEILRFCNRLNYIVVGGLSKLLYHLFEQYDSIITYADLRYGDGHSYEKCGFKFLHKSSPNYYYLDDKYLNRINRLNFQKHKLKDKLNIFDPNLTEWQNMQLNGYDRIWDCGCNVYTWRI